MKPGEINITFTVAAADGAATEKLAREIISRMSLVDGVILENITRYNDGGLIPSIDSISFSRGVDPSPPIASRSQEEWDKRLRGHPFLTDLYHPDGTLDLLKIANRIPSEVSEVDPVISETTEVATDPDKSELQHLLEMGFPLATEEQIKSTASEGLMTPESMAKAGILPQSWIGAPIPPCSFYDDLLDRYDHYLSEDTKLPETGYQSALHLRGMITQLRYDTDQSLTKKHRWLGYIQGVMCAHGLIDVDTERDWTRGLFRGA